MLIASAPNGKLSSKPGCQELATNQAHNNSQCFKAFSSSFLKQFACYLLFLALTVAAFGLRSIETKVRKVLLFIFSHSLSLAPSFFTSIIDLNYGYCTLHQHPDGCDFQSHLIHLPSAALLLALKTVQQLDLVPDLLLVEHLLPSP